MDCFFTSGFAGGGSRQFNHFHAELATGQICSRLTPLTVFGGGVTGLGFCTAQSGVGFDFGGGGVV